MRKQRLPFKPDTFVLSLAVVILLAYFFPYWATEESKLHLNAISSIGVSLIFFFYGLKLSPDKLQAGLSNWKLHLLVQSTTFLLFPLIMLLFYPWMDTEPQSTWWLALFFLAALPSTVSSSVVMVSIAKGNVPAAIFNASLSGIIGILVTPLWMGLFLRKDSTSFDFSEIYLKLLIEIIAPVVAGLFLHRFLGKYVQQHSARFAYFDKAIILLIVYKSFAESFMNHIFDSVSVITLLLLTITVLVLFFLVYFLTGYMARLAGFTLPDQITTQFCGTKKSLVHGTVFAKVLFGNTATVGLMLLPLMLFHAFQIFIISIIASKHSTRSDTR